MYVKFFLSLLTLIPLTCYATELQVSIHNDSSKSISICAFMEPTSITACLKPGEKKAFILTANEKEIVVDFQEKYLAGRTLDGHHEYQEKRYILIFDNPKSKKRTSLTAKRISLTVTELLKAIAVEKDTIKGICSIYVDHANYLH